MTVEQLQQVITRIWADVFDRPVPSADDDFFDCGGNSSTAVELITRLAAQTGHAPSVRQLYEAPSPRQLAAALNGQARGELLPSLLRAPRTGRYPMSLIQEQSVWRRRAFQEAGFAPPAHNAVFLHRIDGALDPDALGRALRQVVDDHPVLRVSFDRHGDKVHQVVADGTDFELRHDRLTAGELTAVAAREWNTPFPDQGPRMRATLHHDTDGWVLVTTLDHDVVDGRSVGLLMAAIGREYAAALAGAAPAAPDPALDYLDWSYSQRRWAARARLTNTIEQWCAARGITGSADELVDVATMLWPSKAVIGTEPVYDATATLPGTSAARIQQVASGNRVTAHTLLVAAVHGWLARRTGRRRLLTFSVMENREAAQVRDMVGWFTNKVPMLADFTADLRFDQLLRQAHAEAIEAHRLQAVPFVLWARRLRTQPARLFGAPSFVMLNYLQGELASADDLALTSLHVQTMHPPIPFVRTAGAVFTVRVTDRAMSVQLSVPLGDRRVADVDADLTDFVGCLDGWLADPASPVCGLD